MKLSAAPTATPTAIQVGSFVAAKTAAPIAVPTPIQTPVFLRLLFFLIKAELVFLYVMSQDINKPLIQLKSMHIKL